MFKECPLQISAAAPILIEDVCGFSPVAPGGCWGSALNCPTTASFHILLMHHSLTIVSFKAAQFDELPVSIKTL
jgi:hypothetical protein